MTVDHAAPVCQTTSFPSVPFIWTYFDVLDSKIAYSSPETSAIFLFTVTSTEFAAGFSTVGDDGVYGFTYLNVVDKPIFSLVAA